MSPADIAKAEAELSVLHTRVHAAEASKASKLAALDALQQQKAQVDGQLALLMAGDAEIAEHVAEAHAAVEGVHSALTEARKTGESR